MDVTLLAVLSIALIPREVLGLDIALEGVTDLFCQPFTWLGLGAFLHVVGGIGLGSSLGADWLQERGRLRLAALAGMVLSGDLALLVDGWGLTGILPSGQSMWRAPRLAYTCPGWFAAGR